MASCSAVLASTVTRLLVELLDRHACTCNSKDEPSAAGLPRCIRDAHTYERRATAALFCRLLLSLPGLSLL